LRSELVDEGFILENERNIIELRSRKYRNVKYYKRAIKRIEHSRIINYAHGKLNPRLA
jgi:hypothetical protein